MSDKMVWNIIEAVNVAAEILIVWVFFSRLYKKKSGMSSGFVFAGYAVYALALWLTGCFTPNQTVLISVTLGGLLVVSFIFYEGTTAKKLFYSLIFIVIVFISEIILFGIFALLGFGFPTQIMEQGPGRILGMICTKIVYFWLVIIVARLINKKVREMPLKQWMLIIAMPIVSTVILYILYYALVGSSAVYGMPIYCVAVVGLLYINFSVFDFFETFSAQIRLSVLEQIVEKETTNYKLIENSYSEMRRLKHDIGNQLQVVNALMEQQNTDSARECLDNITAQLNNAANITYTGDPFIDSIINIKRRDAAADGTEFTTAIEITEIKTDAAEICRILGNVLDNAVEACRNTSQPKIFVSIRETDKKLVLCVSNTADDVDVNNMKTKKENSSAHGIGLKSVKKSVEKLGGVMNYTYNDRIFTINAILDNQ